ncbi:Mitochondrial import inner membrane translocase subunit Tim9 [Platanthera guangdongensis]|uniref:Mitochondrial import inner membrane translocase subunit Tim9 n=1 Tax=Platanthera guangdongensis TaxID=2320717 RepID=A0ABR2MD01_9ASPA
MALGISNYSTKRTTDSATSIARRLDCSTSQLEMTVIPEEQHGALYSTHSFKILFKDGGCGTFVPLLFNLMQSVRQYNQHYAASAANTAPCVDPLQAARTPVDEIMRSALRMYNSVVERCFDDCVDSFKRKTLNKQGETCVRRCAEKFLKHSMRVGMRFAELNEGAAIQD